MEQVDPNEQHQWPPPSLPLFRLTARCIQTKVHTFTSLPFFYTFILSHYNTYMTLSHFHIFTFLVHFHTFTLSECHIFILSHFHRCSQTKFIINQFTQFLLYYIFSVHGSVQHSQCASLKYSQCGSWLYIRNVVLANKFSMVSRSKSSISLDSIYFQCASLLYSLYSIFYILICAGQSPAYLWTPPTFPTDLERTPMQG